MKVKNFKISRLKTNIISYIGNEHKYNIGRYYNVTLNL